MDYSYSPYGPRNLTTTKKADGVPPSKDPIEISWDSKSRTLRFTSRTFDYCQKDLPVDIQYSFYVLLDGRYMALDLIF